MRIRNCCLAMLVAFPPVAAADVVTDWTFIGAQAVVANGGRASLVDIAISQAAVFDAVNAIERRYQPYKVVPTSPARGASPEATAAAAAHRTLVGLMPGQAATLDAAYANTLVGIPDGAAKTMGITLGEEVAIAMLALRANDGRNAVVPPYVFGSGPGVYQPTTPFPATGQPVNTYLPGVTPMVLLASSQFRAYGPPGLTSARYLGDLEETRLYGDLNSTVRTAEQTEIARFHTENPTLFWTRNLGSFVASQGQGTQKNARTMARFMFAVADSSIACFDSKYTYNFWRPSTAIRVTDPTWTPVVSTPAHPEYPAAHGCVTGAVAETMDDLFDDRNLKFTFNSTVTGTTHTYYGPDDLLDEVRNARVWGGMHFRNSGAHGEALGKSVAKWNAKHALKPRDRDWK